MIDNAQASNDNKRKHSSNVGPSSKRRTESENNDKAKTTDKPLQKIDRDIWKAKETN